MSANSRRRNRLLRQQRREAEHRGQNETAAMEASHASADQPATRESAGQPPVEDTPRFKPARKGAKRLLETAAAELEQAEVEFLEEVLKTARDAMTLHHQEVRERIAAHEKGEPVTRRWTVSPGIFEKLVAKGLLVIEILLARRRSSPGREAGDTRALSA
ncbi:MAG: hypothetical protein H6841_04580 [Planctomycetes bacterium]|nr:hypothetical protein [Planctomycetota bacterium]MCB9934673.1 hypothetical protein [Planctomycetota bacterium]